MREQPDVGCFARGCVFVGAVQIEPFHFYRKQGASAYYGAELVINVWLSVNHYLLCFVGSLRDNDLECGSLFYETAY